MNKKLASISMDLDNKWSYLKTHGDPKWETFPSYLDTVAPRFLKLLGEIDQRITVFVIGQDAELKKNHTALRQISDAGHEIANHSFNHEPWLHLYTPQQLEQEFERSELAIETVTGQRTVGFRGPGFSLSDEVLKTLIRRGYAYDCTTFPTFLGPLARIYCFFKSKLSKKQKEDRKDLFGSWSDGFQPNKPFKWVSGNQTLVEIPVTTMPLFKVPIHATYLHFLAGVSPWLAKTYFWCALKLCRLTDVEPSFLLHPLDFLGCDDDPDLGFFPAMNQPAEKKLKLMVSCLAMLQANFDVMPIGEYASCIHAPRRNRCVTRAISGLTGEFANAGN
jgi:hypothetical protein